MDEDHKLFLRCCMPLLKSRNAGVVLAVASVVQYIGPGNSLEEGLVGKALVRVMRNHREVQFVVLNNILALASASPAMFRKHIKDFYVSVHSPMSVCSDSSGVLLRVGCCRTLSPLLSES